MSMRTDPRLCLFARYPTPGEAKTRLIPRIGAARAAALHRRLTQRTLVEMRATGLPLEVRATGMPPAAFSAWLGADIAIVDQGEGDLGQRLAAAACSLPIILIGADVPELAAAHMRAAADLVRAGRVAVGPAEDGGYYLLGLPADAAGLVDFLFASMPWGTDAVLEETRARLAARGVTPIMLETLADLDRPDDLERWPELEQVG